MSVVLKTSERGRRLFWSVWFSDEAHFQLSGRVKSQNYVHWASERPDEVIERNLSVTKPERLQRG